LTSDNIRNVWLNQTGGTGETLKDWLADPMNASYGEQLSADAAAASAQYTELQNYRTQIESPVENIINQFGSSAYQTEVTDPGSGKSVQVRIWLTSPATPWAYVEQVTGGNFGGDATAGNPRSFTLTSTSSTYDYSEYTAAGAGEAWDDFIGFEAEGEFSKVDWSKFDSNYSAEFSFQDISTVTVTPDAWYQGSDVASFAKGPYATGFSEFASGQNNFFFGVGGALSRVYTSLVVAYRPKIVITAGSDFSTYMHQQWEAEAGIEIGPFFFGSETSGSQTSSSVSVENASLVLQSTADWPVIIGMVSAWTVAPES